MHLQRHQPLTGNTPAGRILIEARVSDAPPAVEALHNFREGSLLLLARRAAGLARRAVSDDIIDPYIKVCGGGGLASARAAR